MTWLQLLDLKGPDAQVQARLTQEVRLDGRTAIHPQHRQPNIPLNPRPPCFDCLGRPRRQFGRQRADPGGIGQLEVAYGHDQRIYQPILCPALGLLLRP